MTNVEGRTEGTSFGDDDVGEDDDDDDDEDDDDEAPHDERLGDSMAPGDDVTGGIMYADVLQVRGSRGLAAKRCSREQTEVNLQQVVVNFGDALESIHHHPLGKSRSCNETFCVARMGDLKKCAS